MKNLYRSMQSALFATILIGSCSLFADVSHGEALERQMWEDMKHRNYKDIESNIAAGFQSVHTDGARSREQEIELIKALYLGSYAISEMKVTGEKDSFIVTYKIAVSETIDEKRLADNPMPRMSVWQKINEKWQWVAHANLHPILASTKSLPKPPDANK